MLYLYYLSSVPLFFLTPSQFLLHKVFSCTLYKTEVSFSSLIIPFSRSVFLCVSCGLSFSFLFLSFFLFLIFFLWCTSYNADIRSPVFIFHFIKLLPAFCLRTDDYFVFSKVLLFCYCSFIF